MYLFGRIAMVSLLISMLSGIIWLYQRFFLIREPSNTALLLLSILTGIISFQLLISGFLREMIRWGIKKRHTFENSTSFYLGMNNKRFISKKGKFSYLGGLITFYHIRGIHIRLFTVFVE